MSRPRVLIEDWLPAAAIGVECIRERSTGQQPPDKRLHVWWARRPLTVSRAAVLGSVLPADFPRNVFERLLGFGRSGQEIVEVRRLMDMGYEVPGGFGYDRAFRRGIRFDDLDLAHKAASALWDGDVSIIDPMAGGGSIPLEAVRLGFQAIANEYNPVACSVLEATIDYPFRFGEKLGRRARHWAGVWQRRVEERLAQFYPPHRFAKVHAYIFARTVPTPNAPHPHTPLVPDWHLLKPKSGKCIVAEPIVDHKRNTWSVRIRELGNGAGQLRTPPQATYRDGKGISLFDRTQLISPDYLKAKAQADEMKSALYAVALKTPQGLEFRPPTDADLEAIIAAEAELVCLRPGWEKSNILPTERIPVGDKTGEPIDRGIDDWADMFSPRQFLCFGVLVEELQRLRKEIVSVDGQDLGEAVIHLLGFAIDKFANYNSTLASWHSSHAIVRSVFDRHDFSFKATFAEMAPCNAGGGLNWAIEDSVLGAYEDLCKLKISDQARPVCISLGSATSLPAQIEPGSMTAVVVDPPYAGNVQYSELADFFYVWLKRTQGHRRPEWFSTRLCDHDEEAVVNISRHRDGKLSKKGKRDGSTAEARAKAQAFYEKLMTESFREARRVLRDDGVLTVMFTHKKQEAWASLFTSLIQARFVITATWPVKTESEHSLHQAKKNAAQSTVILVARKRQEQAVVGYFNPAMRAEIRERARASAERLQQENLNPVDQLVGSFGPAIEVYSQYSEVRTDTGEAVGVQDALETASDAVIEWRIEQLKSRGLEGVEPEGRFALLCWDVLGAGEFRFNEAKLLGHAVNMDVDRLVAAGLVSKTGDKIQILAARDRRRERALEPEEVEETLFGPLAVPKRRTKKEGLKVHPNDPQFRTSIDGCHALALRYVEAGGGSPGTGSARALARQQGWERDSSVARLMEALVRAAPEALRHEKGKKSAAAKYPEFRAWHALLEPLFGVAAPDWTEKAPPQGLLFKMTEADLDGESEELEEEESEEAEAEE